MQTWIDTLSTDISVFSVPVTVTVLSVSKTSKDFIIVLYNRYYLFVLKNVTLYDVNITMQTLFSKNKQGLQFTKLHTFHCFLITMYNEARIKK